MGLVNHPRQVQSCAIVRLPCDILLHRVQANHRSSLGVKRVDRLLSGGLALVRVERSILGVRTGVLLANCPVREEMQERIVTLGESLNRIWPFVPTEPN